MSTPLIPTDELVAVAWIKAALGLTNGVSTTLPDQPWEDQQWLQVMQVGGSPDIDLPVFDAAVSINAFAYSEGSAKPPWNKANHLLQQLLVATYQTQRQPSNRVAITLPGDYGEAIVMSVRPLSLPRRIPSDPSQFAAYNMDIGMMWYPAEVTIT